ncbi:hypothetical protein M7I_2529 [Glarea lozoyensis 74030]|uniref:Uncharacterized protein n=1 Tax=Glarea lozoyensis (strain ATCC 74030 / MF5533) TaxID=1104152 RepID=H0EJ06_GLAL7|nr:hypothetical protein M7I_2529 [Glarea lozoyensis 74030]
MTKWTKRKKTKKPVVIEEPEEPVYLAEYSDTTLRDKLLEDCLVTRCQVYNCTIKRTKFSESEIYECIFADLGDEPATDANAFDECKIYSYDPWISWSELHECELSWPSYPPSEIRKAGLYHFANESRFRNSKLFGLPATEAMPDRTTCRTLDSSTFVECDIRRVGVTHNAQLKAFEAEDDKMSSKAWHSLRKLEIL